MKALTLGLLLATLLYVFLVFITPLFRFKPWYKWWKKHQPPGNPQRCMPMALLAYKSSANILYGIAELFLVHQNQKLEHAWQAEFLLNVMGRWAVDVAPNGFLTPYNMCTSLAPIDGDAFYKEHVPRVEARGNEWPTFNGWPQDLPDRIKSKFPPLMLWRGVLSSWGCRISQTGGIDYDSKAWTTNKSNFLYKFYAIPGDSALCMSFMLQTHTDSKGNVWFPLALSTLLGIESDSGAGGWVGLLRAGGDWGGFGLLSMETYVWAHETSSLPQPASLLESCGTSGAAAAALQGMNMGAMGAMALAAVAPPIGMIGGAIGGMIAGGFLGASQYKCI